MCIFDTCLGFRKLLLEKNKISKQEQEQKKRPKQHTPPCFSFCTINGMCVAIQTFFADLFLTKNGII